MPPVCVKRRHISPGKKLRHVKKLPYKQRRGLFTKAFRGVVVVLCCGLCGYQVTDRILLYLSRPVATSFLLRRNSSVIFPKLTFCGSVFGGNQDVLKIFSNESLKWLNNTEPCPNNKPIPVEKMKSEFNLSYLWQEADIGRDFKAKHDITDEDGNILPLQKGKVLTVAGMCITYSFLKPIIPEGQRCCLKIDMMHTPFIPCPTKIPCGPGIKCMQVLAHSNHWEPRYWPLLTEGLTIWHNSSSYYSITIQQFFNLNTVTDPCIPDAERTECLFNCALKVLRTKDICRLPAYDMPEKPACKTLEEAKKVVRFIYESFRRPISDKICGCKRACMDIQYEIKQSESRAKSFRNKTTALFYVHSNLVPTLTEFYVYDAIALLSDVGGILGLFLGVSVLTIFSYAEKVVKQVVVALQKKKLY